PIGRRWPDSGGDLKSKDYCALRIVRGGFGYARHPATRPSPRGLWITSPPLPPAARFCRLFRPPRRKSSGEKPDRRAPPRPEHVWASPPRNLRGNAGSGTVEGVADPPQARDRRSASPRAKGPRSEAAQATVL